MCVYVFKRKTICQKAEESLYSAPAKVVKDKNDKAVNIRHWHLAEFHIKHT